MINDIFRRSVSYPTLGWNELDDLHRQSKIVAADHLLMKTRILLEDEANFIGYLACVESKDPLFRYSALLSVIGYLDRDFARAVGKDSMEYQSHIKISGQVLADKIFLTKEAWQQVEERAVLDTETVSQAADSFLNTTLTLNGVSDGTVSYSRVVDLLLQYYDGILY